VRCVGFGVDVDGGGDGDEAGVGGGGCGGTAEFEREDGTREKVRRSMVVGCDGARLEDCGITMLKFCSTYEASTARLLRTRHPIFKNSYHPDLDMMYRLSSKFLFSFFRPREVGAGQGLMSE